MEGETRYHKFLEIAISCIWMHWAKCSVIQLYLTSHSESLTQFPEFPVMLSHFAHIKLVFKNYCFNIYIWSSYLDWRKEVCTFSWIHSLWSWFRTKVFNFVCEIIHKCINKHNFVSKIIIVTQRTMFYSRNFTKYIMLYFFKFTSFQEIHSCNLRFTAVEKKFQKVMRYIIL